MASASPEVAALHAAAAAGDAAAVKRLLDVCNVPAHAQEDVEGMSALMHAASGGHGEVISLLLAAGAPWNAIDRRGRCAGNHALDNNHQTIVDALVDAAVRAELLLGAAERASSRAVAAKAAESGDYLSRAVRYEGDTLFDAGDDAVMMEWERPLMEEHARRLCATGGDVLNVGFGMGIIDGAIAKLTPRSHTIIEAHQGVLARMRADGWHGRRGVRVCEGRWQDAVQTLVDEGVCFDGIFFDTYGEHDADMADFHAALPRLLRPGGLYSFFNGMCPFNRFFQGVACAVVQLELQALGLSTTFESVAIATPSGDAAAWEGVKRQYFHDDTYYLPHAVFDEGASATAAAEGTGASAMDDAGGAAGDGGAASQLIALNGAVIRLMARSLLDGNEADNLRAILGEHIFPHFESAGWQLATALGQLWAAPPALSVRVDAVPNSFIESYLASRTEYDASLALSPAERLAAERAAAEQTARWQAVASACLLIDANSAAVVAEAARIAHALGQAGAAPVADEELQLAIPPNPLAAGDEDADEAMADADGAATAAAGGRDSEHRHFVSADEFAAATPTDEWYGTSRAYWSGVKPDVDGMLGGLGDLHDPDVEGSLALIDRLRSEGDSLLPDGVALDCGAGIGRVSHSVLLKRFGAVELLEPSGDFLAAAKAALPPGRVKAFHEVGLQDFVPAERATGRYALVWIQWVVNYLTDDDLAGFLARCASALLPHGHIVLKESVSRPNNGFYVDRSDASITRTDEHFRRIFARAGLRVVLSQLQPGFPRAIFPVCMYALKPEA